MSTVAFRRRTESDYERRLVTKAAAPALSMASPRSAMPMPLTRRGTWTTAGQTGNAKKSTGLGICPDALVTRVQVAFRTTAQARQFVQRSTATSSLTATSATARPTAKPSLARTIQV